MGASEINIIYYKTKWSLIGVTRSLLRLPTLASSAESVRHATFAHGYSALGADRAVGGGSRRNDDCDVHDVQYLLQLVVLG